MPQPRGRRHPLFLRLTKPIEPIYPKAVTPVAWDDDEPLEEAEGVVYIVTRQCARMRTWARQLRKLHGADETYKTEEGISPLSAAPLREANLRELGTSIDLYSEHGGEVLSAKSAVRAYVTTDLLAVVTERADGDAVGFVSFRLKWIVDAFAGRKNEAELEVELDQAWMAPAFRKRRWGEMAAIAISFATERRVTEEQRRSAAVIKEATDAQTQTVALDASLPAARAASDGVRDAATGAAVRARASACLPPQARPSLVATPLGCSLTCSAGLTNERESWRNTLTGSGLPASPASAPTTR